MPARLTAYVPERAACVRVLADDAELRIGRDAARACDVALPLEHASVSRRHATLRNREGRWELEDLGSKNGSFVDGRRTLQGALPDECWLRFGDVYCEFERLSTQQAQVLERRAAERRQSSALLERRATEQRDLDGMLRETLRAAVELSGCERGFLLLGAGDALAVRASFGLEPAALTRREFSGSIGAVRRALEEDRAVVANDVSATPWLGSRHSVVAGGIAALVCVPMHEAGRSIGAVYADSRERRARISELDLDLLCAFVDRMSLAIATRAAADALGALAERAQSWRELVAAAGSDR